MAVIRKQIQVKQLGNGENNIFDLIVETTTDLDADELEFVAPGSLALCLEDGKVYCKGSDDDWVEVA